MSRSTTALFALLGFACATADLPGVDLTREPAGPCYEGVIARIYNNPDFTRMKRCLEPDGSLETFFDDSQGHGIDWSGIWEGFLTAPATGELTLHLTAWKPTTLTLPGRGSMVTEGPTGVPVKRSLTIPVAFGEALPFRIDYVHARGGRGGWAVEWSLDDGEPETIPASALFIDDRLADYYNWEPEPDRDSIDMTQFARAEQEDVIVYYEPGRATGWPANQGFFTWGDEILMTFSKGYHLDRGLNHSIDPTRPGENLQLRSIDGGSTWIEEPHDPVAPDDVTRLPRDLDFDGPGFALRTYGDSFVYTRDRGRNWSGPYRWPDLGLGAYTNRTDVHPLRPGHGLLGFSVEAYENPAKHSDHTFFVELDEKNSSLRFLGWLTPPSEPVRAVMPNTVVLGNGHFITVSRRKQVEHFDHRPPVSRNWIEAFESKDGARTWRSLGEIAETDRGRFNGNPPSLVHLGGDRLAAVYGFRGVPYSIRARLSDDLGRSWSREILLRDDILDFDCGYVRSAVRSDGRIISVYYLKTADRNELHFEGTIWNPKPVE